MFSKGVPQERRDIIVSSLHIKEGLSQEKYLVLISRTESETCTPMDGPTSFLGGYVSANNGRCPSNSHLHNESI